MSNQLHRPSDTLSVQDATHDRIATQSGGDECPSLLGLPEGRVVALIDGRLIARRAKVALLGEAELRAAAKDRPVPHLHEDDTSGPHGQIVTTLLQLAREWGTSRPEPVVDLRGLLAEWSDDTDTTSASGLPSSTSSTSWTRDSPQATTQGAASLAALPDSDRTSRVIQLPRQDDRQTDRQDRPDLRTWLLRHLVAERHIRRAELVEGAITAGWSKSGAHKAINALVGAGEVVENPRNGELAPLLWAGAQ